MLEFFQTWRLHIVIALFIGAVVIPFLPAASVHQVLSVLLLALFFMFVFMFFRDEVLEILTMGLNQIRGKDEQIPESTSPTGTTAQKKAKDTSDN